MSVLGIVLILLQAQLATASGIVTRPGGTDPLSGATVVLNPVLSTQSARVRIAISQDDGRFTLQDIEPGEYRLQVQSPYYGTASYGQRKLNGPGAILTITAGQRLSDIKLSMAPTGTVSGRVTGRNGEPLAYATVQALRTVYQKGNRVLSVAQTTTTDDRGEYRLFWLNAGKYVVVAAPRSSPSSTGVTTRPRRPGETAQPFDLLLSLASPVPDGMLESTYLVTRLLEDGTVREESWMPTYYPSTIEPARATAVDVAAGATVPGVDIILGPSPVQKIRGRVTGIVPGSQPTVAMASSSQGTISRMVNKAASMIDGAFEFAGVVPGTYYLTAQDRSGLAARPLTVVVADRDVEDLSLPLTQAARVSARINVEGVKQVSPELLAGLFGTLSPEFGVLVAGPVANFVPRSTQFVSGNIMLFSNVPPGDYLFDISQGVLRDDMRRLHVKSVRLGSNDALETINIPPGTNDVVLEVVLTTQTGTVDGIALGRAGDPAANATVVLVPTNARKRTPRYQAVVTGSDGKFRFQEIPPGDYKLFAWEDIETGAWENAEFMRAYESRGRAVRVAEGSREEVPLSVIYNP